MGTLPFWGQNCSTAGCQLFTRVLCSPVSTYGLGAALKTIFPLNCCCVEIQLFFSFLFLLARLRHCLPSCPAKRGQTPRPGDTMEGDSKHCSIMHFPGEHHLLKLLLKPSTRLISPLPLKRTGTHTTVKPSQGCLS